MLNTKISNALKTGILICAAIFSQIVFADTCPDMSSTAQPPSGWYLTFGPPLPTGNQFAGATWTGTGISCVYNPAPLPTFVLLGLDVNLKPLLGPSTAWSCNTQICRCASNQYAACPFADGSSKK